MCMLSQAKVHVRMNKNWVESPRRAFQRSFFGPVPDCVHVGTVRRTFSVSHFSLVKLRLKINRIIREHGYGITTVKAQL